jgi:hypothetical protein
VEAPICGFDWTHVWKKNHVSEIGFYSYPNIKILPQIAFDGQNVRLAV